MRKYTINVSLYSLISSKILHAVTWKTSKRQDRWYWTLDAGWVLFDVKLRVHWDVCTLGGDRKEGIRTMQGFTYLWTSMWMKKKLGCHAEHQEVSRCCTRGKFEESIVYRWGSAQVGINPDFETHCKCCQKSKREVPVAPKKNWWPPKICKQRDLTYFYIVNLIKVRY